MFTTAEATPILPRLLEALRSHRAQHAHRRDLARELATYRTPAEINDLLLLASRTESAEADDVRDVLLDNLVAWERHAA